MCLVGIESGGSLHHNVVINKTPIQILRIQRGQFRGRSVNGPSLDLTLGVGNNRSNRVVVSFVEIEESSEVRVNVGGLRPIP